MSKIHFTAIGGTGMGAMAGLMAEIGHEVQGSDQAIYPPMSTLLKELNIQVAEGFGPQNLDWHPDLVVLGNTCKKDHIEYLAAQERGIRIISFPELLSETFLRKRHSIVVAGTHGKTTTTSLITHVLHHAGLNPGYLVGGIPTNFGRSFSSGSAPYFVVEGDEYDTACFDKRPKFVHYCPRTAILTGVEFDHADIYKNLAQVEAAFAMLIKDLPSDGMLLVYADSKTAVRLSKAAQCLVETYAVTDTHQADWKASFRALNKEKQELKVFYHNEHIGQFEIKMTGAHNMSNALAVIATAYKLGLSSEKIAAGLKSFLGVRRRQEVVGKVNNITVIDDFAHHPTAIRETLNGLRGVHGSGNLIAVFEPRSGTSRRNVFQKEFPVALSTADHVVLAPVFAAEKLPLDQRLNVEQVASDIREAGTKAISLLSVKSIVDYLALHCTPGDTVVVMSSGGFDGIHNKLLAAFEKQSKDPSRCSG